MNCSGIVLRFAVFSDKSTLSASFGNTQYSNRAFGVGSSPPPVSHGVATGPCALHYNTLRD